MGENIYGDKKYGLRELIQNSIDACMIMKEESMKIEDFKYMTYQPFIKIILDEDKKQVIILDNGRGMSIDILKNYFLNVGISYYSSDDYLFKGNTYNPIGNYGIGFLACFMLSDKISVITKSYGEIESNKIEFEKNSEYICLTCENISRPQGTEIILDYAQFMSVFDNSNTVKSFIQNNFLNSTIPIHFVITKNGETIEETIPLKTIEEIYPDGQNLSEYFDGIDVIIQFNHKGVNFLETFSDIQGNENLVYDENKHIMIREDSSAEPILLKNYVKDGVIKYLQVPIISSYDEADFEKAYDVLEDFDEALAKIDYETANILSNNPSLYNRSELLEFSDDIIVDEYSLADFQMEFSHADVPTYTYLFEKKVILGTGLKILPYKTNKKFDENHFFEHTDHLYIKNVLISNSHLTIPFLAEGIYLKGAIVNVLNKRVIPNVSRNNISKIQNEALSYAIGKALHMWIYEHGNLQSDEKELIKTFINQCYPDRNDYLKQDIQSPIL